MKVVKNTVKNVVNYIDKNSEDCFLWFCVLCIPLFISLVNMFGDEIGMIGGFFLIVLGVLSIIGIFVMSFAISIYLFSWGEILWNRLVSYVNK